MLDAAAAAEATATADRPPVERRRRLSQAALAVTNQKVRPAYSPVVIAGAVRVADFVLLSLVGVSLYLGYVARLSGFHWEYVAAIFGMTASAVVCFQAADIYEVQVFTSGAGARHLLGQQISTESTAARGEPGLAMSRLPGFPGSVVISAFSVRAHEGSTTLLVTTGRCMLKVADALSHVSTRAQSKRAAFAVATLRLARLRPLCA